MSSSLQEKLDSLSISDRARNPEEFGHDRTSLNLALEAEKAAHRGAVEENKIVSRELEKSKKTIQVINEKLDRLTESLREKEREYSDVQERERNALRRINDLEQELEIQLRTAAVDESAISQLKQQILSLEKNISELHEELRRFRDDKLLLTKENQELKRQTDKAQIDLKMLSSRIETLTEKVHEKETVLSETQERERSAVARVKHLEAEVTSLTSNFEKEISTLKRNFQSEIDALKLQGEDDSREIARLKNSIRLIEEKHASEIKHMQEVVFKKREALIEEKIRTLENQVSDAQRQSNEYKEMCEAATRRVKSLEADLSLSNKVQDRYQVRINDLTNEVASLTAALEQSNGTTKTLLQENMNLQNKASSFQKETYVSQERIRELSEKIAEQEVHFDRQSQQLRKSQQEEQTALHEVRRLQSLLVKNGIPTK